MASAPRHAGKQRPLRREAGARAAQAAGALPQPESARFRRRNPGRRPLPPAGRERSEKKRRMSSARFQTGRQLSPRRNAGGPARLLQRRDGAGRGEMPAGGYAFFFFFFFNNFTYLFIYLFFGCVGSSFLREGFLQLWQVGATLHRGARASHYCGLSCCGAQAPDAQAQ